MAYSFSGRVRYSEIGENGLLTLPGILNYFQDCSTFQSEEVGLGIDILKEWKRIWVLSAWQVVVDRYPYMGERIKTSTWAYGFRGFMGLRNFTMETEAGNAWRMPILSGLILMRKTDCQSVWKRKIQMLTEEIREDGIETGYGICTA